MIGYDNHILGNQCVLDLPFEEMSGVVTYCRGKTDIVATLTGVPVWTQLASGLPYLEFDAATPDYVDALAADTTGLNFIGGDFSMMIWAKADVLTASHTFLCRGLANVDGWRFYCTVGGIFGFISYSGPATVVASDSGEIVTGIWYLLGLSRTGTSVRLHKNGRDVTFTGSINNPITAVRDLNIGVVDDKTSNPFDGSLYRPRIWSRYLQPWEHRMVYDMEGWMFP